MRLLSLGMSPYFVAGAALVPMSKAAGGGGYQYHENIAETLGDPYHKQVPLPSIPAYRAREATT